MIHKLLKILLFVCLSIGLFAQSEQVDPNVNLNDTSVQDIGEIKVILDLRKVLKRQNINEISGGKLKYSLNGTEYSSEYTDFKIRLPSAALASNGINIFKTGDYSILLHSNLESAKVQIKIMPLWLSIVPPLLAIIIALIFKEVIVALFIGIWSGAFIAGGYSMTNVTGMLSSFLSVLTEYILGALADADHLSVILFSLLIGGMVALISKNGGMQGVVISLSKYARTPKSAQFITWLMGVAIFFDDYANTLIVGNTMRSVTDKFKISREKLAYIVDSTAAPVSAIAFITTWIGAELGYIDDGITKLGIDVGATPYAIFLASLKYSFYPILTLIFLLIIIHTKRDFGPMLKAENRARTTGKVSPARTDDEDEPDMEDLSPVKGAPMKALHAIIPVATVIIVTIIGLLITGFDSLESDLGDLLGSGIGLNTWKDTWSLIPVMQGEENLGFFAKLGAVIGASNSYVALLWSSLLGVVVALAITTLTRTMKLLDASHWMVAGFKAMMPALIILSLAWALAITTDELHTADYISAALEGSVNPILLPAIIFVLAAFIAFSTGSSWSTMAILYPIAIPTSYAVCMAAGVDPALNFEILLAVIATVLGASVLGDHISPISDTTILSSLASDCNHLDHVKTQFPYAIIVGIVSIIGLTMSIFLGGGGFICLIMFVLCILALFFIVKYVGKNVEELHA